MERLSISPNHIINMPTLKEISGLFVSVVLPIRGTISKSITGTLNRIYYPDKADAYLIGTADNCLLFGDNDVDRIETGSLCLSKTAWIIRLKA